MGRSQFPHLQQRDNNLCLRHCAVPVSWRGENLDGRTGWLLLLGERHCMEEPDVLASHRRAYVIKLFHDIQSRSGVRAKNYSFALVKC